MPNTPKPPRDVLAIVGSRTYLDYEMVKSVLDRGARPDLVVSGGAEGADTLGKQWANEKGIICEIYKPDYILNGKAAPFIRNTLIAERCTRMIAFWDGESRGTLDVISKAIRTGKVVVVVPRAVEAINTEEPPKPLRAMVAEQRGGVEKTIPFVMDQEFIDDIRGGY